MADLNGDNAVSVEDLLALLANFGLRYLNEFPTNQNHETLFERLSDGQPCRVPWLQRHGPVHGRLRLGDLTLGCLNPGWARHLILCPRPSLRTLHILLPQYVLDIDSTYLLSTTPLDSASLSNIVLVDLSDTLSTTTLGAVGLQVNCNNSDSGNVFRSLAEINTVRPSRAHLWFKGRTAWTSTSTSG